MTTNCFKIICANCIRGVVAAQKYCFKNYVEFNTPFSSQGETAKVATAGEICYWSFVPKTDCNVVFSATGRYDTVGYILDADSYVYSTNRSVIQSSAIEYNDDMNNDEMNFAIMTKLTAGKRYYLSTALKSISKTGSFDVQFSSTCASHIYEITGVEGNVLTGRRSLVKAKCVGCSSQTSIDFGTAVVENTSYCDVNNDGIVNAKDYAIIIHK